MCCANSVKFIKCVLWCDFVDFIERNTFFFAWHIDTVQIAISSSRMAAHNIIVTLIVLVLFITQQNLVVFD